MSRSAFLAVFLLSALARADELRSVAVLPLARGESTLTHAEIDSLDLKLWSKTVEVIVPMGFNVLSRATASYVEFARSNTKAMCDAECVISTAKAINARYIISGALKSADGKHLIFLGLFDGPTGVMKSVETFDAPSEQAFETQFSTRVEQLFRLAHLEAAKPVAAAPPPVVVTPPPPAPMRPAPVPVAAEQSKSFDLPDLELPPIQPPDASPQKPLAPPSPPSAQTTAFVAPPLVEQPAPPPPAVVAVPPLVAAQSKSPGPDPTAGTRIAAWRQQVSNQRVAAWSLTCGAVLLGGFAVWQGVASASSQSQAQSLYRTYETDTLNPAVVYASYLNAHSAAGSSATAAAILGVTAGLAGGAAAWLWLAMPVKPTISANGSGGEVTLTGSW